MLPTAGIIWAAGFVTILVVWRRRWLRVRAAVRSASPVPLPVGVPAVSSPAFFEPGVFGIRRPVLLLPDGIANHLSSSQFEAVLAHELCHVRRRDNLATSIHMLVESVFWFHPLVWWLGARLMDERELACDEEVVRMGNAPQIYAEGILKVCELYLESPLACVAGVTGSNLKARIEAIVANRSLRSLGRVRKLLLAVVGIAAVAGPFAIGVIDAPPMRGQGQPGAPLSFEVASVKLHANAGGYNILRIPNGKPIHISGNRVTESVATLRDLIMDAYDVKDYQVTGGPPWTEPGAGDHFDIEARAPGAAAPTVPQARLMLQSLLADRFQLKFHREPKELPAYDLVIAPKGIKMTAIPPDAPPSSDKNPPGVKITRTDISALLALISVYADRPVIDKTGLTGAFEYSTAWARPELSLKRGLSAGAEPADDSLFTALVDQLGLKLEPRKGPVEVLVIDHVAKPTAN